jgi:hypothetical protein
LKWYFTGVPCKHGHVAERYVGNGGCVECRQVYYLANKEGITECHRAYYEANPEKTVAREATRRDNAAKHATTLNYGAKF